MRCLSSSTALLEIAVRWPTGEARTLNVVLTRAAVWGWAATSKKLDNVSVVIAMLQAAVLSVLQHNAVLSDLLRQRISVTAQMTATSFKPIIDLGLAALAEGPSWRAARNYLPIAKILAGVNEMEFSVSSG